MSDFFKVKNLNKTYRVGKKNIAALQDINFTIRRGETFGIIGESGSGKSTLGKLMLRLEEPSSGEIYFQNTPLHTLHTKEMWALRRSLQIVFQDSYGSLNPCMSIADIVSEGLAIHTPMNRTERYKCAADILAQVGLPPSFLDRYPRELSGGQRQRINIARALVVDPEFVVCDEPVSALDASVQAQVMELLILLKKERELTYLFISHDLDVIYQIADTVAVMYLGQIVEQGPTKAVFDSPQHPYTQALISACSRG